MAWLVLVIGASLSNTPACNDAYAVMAIGPWPWVSGFSWPFPAVFVELGMWTLVGCALALGLLLGQLILLGCSSCLDRLLVWLWVAELFWRSAMSAT
ncbi:hypothetical protein Nepgr_022926 [Nepenthes gracilis]|uniref:Uncharacterized protein n=1 Tax=Nepenthes gracilis TaxID=150966 RepID=A0AAD3T1P4_NEPGR|nr:hypothetical protein Nepgr_022926 [Nepenthes gracilis]